MIVLLALLLLAGVTAVHEVGHWAAIRAKGGQVPSVRIGHGPTIWRGRRGGTEVVVSAFPVGGRIHYEGVAPGTGEAVVAVGGAAANLAAAFLAFAAIAWLGGAELSLFRDADEGPVAYAASHAGRWFWAVPGALIDLVTTGRAADFSAGVQGLLRLLAERPATTLPYAAGAASSLWAAFNLLPLPLLETDGWHVVRALWRASRGGAGG